eukprot:m.10829 g.10829  ORF g.10829 m.10829 type:complete len:322 (-) comp8507_c0_seq1:139-1104(-)
MVSGYQIQLDDFRGFNRTDDWKLFLETEQNNLHRLFLEKQNPSVRSQQKQNRKQTQKQKQNQNKKQKQTHNQKQKQPQTLTEHSTHSLHDPFEGSNTQSSSHTALPRGGKTQAQKRATTSIDNSNTQRKQPRPPQPPQPTTYASQVKRSMKQTNEVGGGRARSSSASSDTQESTSKRRKSPSTLKETLKHFAKIQPEEPDVRRQKKTVSLKQRETAKKLLTATLEKIEKKHGASLYKRKLKSSVATIETNLLKNFSFSSEYNGQLRSILFNLANGDLGDRVHTGQVSISSIATMTTSQMASTKVLSEKTAATSSENEITHS